MTIASLIWLFAAVDYALFWWWYVGFNKKIKPHEIEPYLSRLAIGKSSAATIELMGKFMQDDDGKEFVMVNLLGFRRPGVEGEGEDPRKTLEKYQKPFLAQVLRRGGHPMFVSRALAGSVEHWGLGEDTKKWSAAGLIRYRSRRDLLECLLLPGFQDTHHFKEAALEKTFAFPSTVMFNPTSPRWMALLLVLLIASVLHLLIG